MKNLKLSTRLYTVLVGVLFLTAIVGTIALIGMHKTTGGLETVYNDRVVPLQQLKTISDDYAVFIIDAVNKANAGLFTAEQTVKGVDEASLRIKRNWTAYTATKLTLDEARLVKEAEQLFPLADAAVERFRQYLASKNGSVKDTLNEFDGPLYTSIDPVTAKVTEIVDLQLRVAETEYRGAQARFRTVFGLCLTLLIGGLALGGGAGWWMVRSIIRTIKGVTNSMSSGAAQTVSAATQVSSASQSQAECASEQAAALEETSSSLEEMSSMTQKNSENAQNAAALAQQARAAAENGAADMQAMNTAMEAIKQASDDIAKIIKTIDEIAFQTNILALNAAVEAARAGEAGMGFAVVADEVRNLAQRCAQAAKETAGKIEGAITRTSQGVGISAKVAQGLQQIVALVRQVDELVAEVATASKEQHQGIGQINKAIGEMDKVTQSNAANAEESASAAEELNAQAESLNEAVIQLLRLVEGFQGDAIQASKQQVSFTPEHKAMSANTIQTIVKTNGKQSPQRSIKQVGINVGALDRPHHIASEQSFTDF